MEIVTFVSIGDIFFNATRADVRNKLASPFFSFRKGKEPNETDGYNDLGLHVYYDDSDTVEFVEAFDPAEVTFRGVTFLGRDVDEVMADMEGLGFDAIEPDEGCMDFLEAGIALYAPTGVVEGVAAFRKGYFDKIAE